MSADGARPALWGVLAEFDAPEGLLAAAEAVRDAGFTRWDTYSPFPVHGIDRAMGMRPTGLPWLVLGGGMAGAVGGILLQWWTNAEAYPFQISGKPLFSLPANIPVAFELTILLAAFAAFFGMLTLNRLPQLYNVLFDVPRFRRATDDRFFIAIEASDPRFDTQRVTDLLSGIGAQAVELVEKGGGIR